MPDNDRKTFEEMRSEEEMLNLILNTAREDDRIRAVILNGSRVNPNITPDHYQDFDVVYVVTSIAPFVDEPAWIDRFGERMILQTPDLMEGEEPRQDGGFTFLMQFMDGNRIDLTLIPIDHIEDMEPDSLSVLLLDKDDCIPPFPTPSEASYLPSPPTEKAFADCCNEFWWVSPYVAKALARSEILYAKHLLDVVLRAQLMKMLTWVFGIKTNFERNPGKSGKHFHEVLSANQWKQLLGTYATANNDQVWKSLFTMCKLFRDCAQFVGSAFDYDYPSREDQEVSAYLYHIHEIEQRIS